MRFAFAALTALLALSAPAARAAAPVFTPGPCAVDLSQTGRRFDCGTLVVDETRGSSNGRKVALPVAILRASTPDGSPPVIYLHGGPGGEAVGRIKAYLATPGGKVWLGRNQDVVFFDQRGGGLSAPLLDCGSLALTDAGSDTDATVGALKACAARHAAAGVDLSRYNAAEVSKDVQDLRAALKLPMVDLFGVSYGTRIALEIVRDRPQGVRAVVLDSLWPPEAKWAEDGAAPVARAARLILSLCAKDPTCTVPGKADLAPHMDALVRRWLVAPQGPPGGPLFPVDDFAQYVMDAAYDGPAARAFPGELAKMLAGDFSPLADYRAGRSVYSEAQHFTHLCKEQLPFESRAKTVANAGNDPVAQALARTLLRDFDACEGFPVGPPLAGDDRPVTSDLPILVLSAGVDPGCPPELARAAVKRFSHGQLVLFPYATHGVSRVSPCGATLIQAFFRNPGAPVDTRCVGVEQTGFHFGGAAG